MSKASLKNRTSGFASCESSLFNLPAGYVKYLSKTTIKLRKSIFTDACSPDAIKLPSGISPPDGAFVWIDIEGSAKWDMSGATPLRYYDAVKVTEMNPLDLDLGKPNLYNDDVIMRFFGLKDEFKENAFIHRIGSYWKDADKDHLDWTLAVLLMSCPGGAWGEGGTGGESFSEYGSTKQSLKEIKQFTDSILPKDLRAPNGIYEYYSLSDRSTSAHVVGRRSRRVCPEISYNYLYNIGPEDMMPIQVAAVIRDARYKGIKALYDPDIIDFMIYAQMIKPSINDDLIKSIEKSALRVNKIKDRNAEISIIDSYAIGKLTSALCRMNLDEKMTESMIYEATKIFEENYKQYIDLRERSEEHPYRQSYNLDYAKSQNIRDRVTARDQKVFNIIKDAREELGIEWISKTMIQERREYGIGQDYDLMYSLQLLLNLGHIISRKNMNEFKNIHS
jgi:hypothetical protein